MRCNFYFHVILFFFIMSFSSVISEYRWHKCNNDSSYADGSKYSVNLNRVMSDLFTNTSVSSGFNTSSFGQTPNKIYGLLQCFGNLSAQKCSECAQQANSSLMEVCANNIGGLVLMDDCFLRYDNSNFISTLDTNPYVYLWNPGEVSGNVEYDFKSTTATLLSNLSSVAYNPANRRFAMGSANYSTSQFVYGLVQCWRYLPISDCRQCLFKARNAVEDCCSTNKGGRALLGSCVVRFESDSFFGTPDVSSPQASPPTPTTSPPPVESRTPSTPAEPPTERQTPTTVESPTDGAGQTQSESEHSHLILCLLNCIFDMLILNRVYTAENGSIVPIILGVVGGLIMLLVVCLTAMRKRLKSVIFATPVTRNEERHGYSAESGLLMHEHQNFIMSLEELAEATHNFHENNKLGEGGFGPVYRGTTRDGKQIAVKKLSARSTQGKREFMNEVKLMANVQHRNLVKLLGCCAEGDERLLIYEYFPNKSLDTFLFDREKRRLLNWEKRYNIITGIARGLLYLHEDSQMKIIHRDIKANNILLDDKLNAKIADFGLARLFPEDETHIQTRIAGTFGYMAPEYAMRGRLSVKADVYSFGVLLLEILSGRKNSDANLEEGMQNLSEWAWRLYLGGDAITMVESAVGENCRQDLAVRCIHVALLCVQADAAHRPVMSNVILMISSKSVRLPIPTKPAFFSCSDSRKGVGLERHEKRTPTFTESQTSGTTASSASGVPSVNDISITDAGPR